MHTIEKEIFSQSEALIKTLEYMERNAGLVKGMFNGCNKVVFMGCGSSYMLCEGAAALFGARTKLKSMACAGGEVMLNPGDFKNLFDGALVVVPSRSGETSEVLRAIAAMRPLSCFKLLSIVAAEDSGLSKISELTLELPWIFDASVCQTRTVSNLYLALLYLAAAYDPAAVGDLRGAISGVSEYIETITPICRSLAARDWKTVTVLADGELCGIAREGALAFGEISTIAGDYFKLLDYRHGPAVLADRSKLIIAVIRDANAGYSRDFVRDVRQRGAYVITIGPAERADCGGDTFIAIPPLEDYAAWGFYLVAVCQLTAFYKALAVGHDPDQPNGLDPYIKL